MKIITSVAELRTLIGQEVGVSDWMDIDQARINLFAEASGDHQWIHVDTERSQRESPYGNTVAHGFLTLSLLPSLLSNTIMLSGVKMSINYGLNRVRFPAAVLVGDRVRGRISLMEVNDIADAVQVIWQVTMECENQGKPACVAEMIVRTY